MVNFIIKQTNHRGESVDAGARRHTAGRTDGLRDASNSSNPHIRKASELLDANPDAATVLHSVGDEYHIVNGRGWTIRTVTA